MKPGIYNASLVIRKANGSLYGPIALLQIEYVGDPEQVVALPKTITMSQGTRLQLVKPHRDDFDEYFCDRISSNKKVATVNSHGELAAKAVGTAEISVRESATDYWFECIVKVVPNSFRRTKPLVRAERGVYSSTKRLYYSGGALKAEVYVYNRTKQSIRGCSGYVFRLYKDERLLYEKPLGALKFKSSLRSKCSKVYKLTITEKMLAGVKAKQFDLGTGRMHAVIASVNPSQPVQPLIKGMDGAVQVKAMETAW